MKAVRSNNLPKEGVLEEMLKKQHDAESASSVETVLLPKGDLIQAVFTLYR